MRKTTPFLILAVGLLALAIDLLPNLKLPNTGAAGGTRPIETKLGLDLRGGIARFCRGAASIAAADLVRPSAPISRAATDKFPAAGPGAA